MDKKTRKSILVGQIVLFAFGICWLAVGMHSYMEYQKVALGAVPGVGAAPGAPTELLLIPGIVCIIPALLLLLVPKHKPNRAF